MQSGTKSVPFRMLALTKMSDYAVAVLMELARTPDRAQSAHQASLAVGLPAPTVRKLLKELCRARLVLSERGSNGGYRLGRPPESIPIAEIVETFEGKLALTECILSPTSCGQVHTCSASDAWFRINDALRRVLSEFTLQDMLSERRAGPPSPGVRRAACRRDPSRDPSPEVPTRRSRVSP
jgi:FeS assembly SUF system regulator